MATISSKHLTLLELAKRVQNKNAAQIAEVLNESNEYMQDSVWVEANQIDGHRGTIRQSLPSGTWRKLNKGVDRERSDTKQITESIGQLTAYSEIDRDLVEMAPDRKKFRNQEDMAFVEGLGQEISETFVYGNTTTDPEEFDGLAPRLNDLKYDNVIDGGGSGNDLSSLYIVQWGVNMAHFIYPRGSAIGLSMEDQGIKDAEDSNGNKYEVYRSKFQSKIGFFVHDARCIIRIANIETSGSSNIFDHKLLIKALRMLPFGGRGAVIYANGTLMEQMDLDIVDKSNVTFTPQLPYGRMPEGFRNFPVRRMDAILDTEAAVTDSTA